jgi:2,4-dienoyl-CoA reductase-like NADH-dependent reductase (Old Yellow Enzyme family)
MTGLAELFSPLGIGPLHVANRIMLPGMSAGMMLDAQARPTDEMIAYFIERAQTRPGLIAVGASAVVPPPSPERHPLALYDDAGIPALAKLVDAVHRYDTRFGIQLWDGGTQAGRRIQLSPSGLAAMAMAVGDKSRGAPTIKTLTRDEIAGVVADFAAAAARCVRAGFDFVEIHAGHGYLLSAFLTPHFNRRTDEYGGTFENRARFLLETLRAVRRAVGRSVGVGVKINGEDYLPQDGWTVSDACRIAPMLQADGADYLSVTAGVMGSTRLTVPPMYEKQGCFADLAIEVKKHVSIPVATIGRIKNPVMANDLVKSRQVDIVCMGRAMIADSGIVEKARRGALHEIRPCLAECRGCIDQEMRSIKRGHPGQVSCVVNPRMQRESVCIDVEGNRKANPRTVLVIGAGLAGLEAARRCAFSGHRVTLCERRAWLGGQIRLAAKIPGRHEIADMLPWYGRQLDKYGVDVRLNTNVDAALLASLAPDVVFVATGSVGSVPQAMVASISTVTDIEMLMIDDVLEHGTIDGRNVLVVGGDQIGMQAADFLSESGRRVWVAESHGHFAQKLAANDRWYLIARTMQKDVKRYKNVHGIGIEPGGTVQLLTGSGPETLSGIDTIVFASERRSDRGLAEHAKARGLETYVVGDAADVTSEDSGTILATITQAYDIARSI